MSHHRVGVLRGGPSNEYEVSLETGKAILNNIPKDKYHPIDIFIDRDGVWHIHGMPKSIHEALHGLDVVVNALHGHFGEDGKVQSILDHHNMPYTGSGSIASAIGMNKVLSKKLFKQHGIKTPYHVTFEKEHGANLTEKELHEMAVKIFSSFPVPAVIKPASSGSSVGVSIAHTVNELVHSLSEAFKHGSTVLVEELVRGVEATVGVIEHFRDHDLYALPPIEIRPHGGSFFDYKAKYQHGSDKIVPGNFTHEQKAELEEAAKAAHKALGLRHYSRSDFIVTPRRGVYILEVNTLPGLTEESLIPKALGAVGGNLPQFLHHLIQLAMTRK